MSIKKLCIVLLLPACIQTAHGAEPKPSASLPAAPQTLEDARAQKAQAAAMRKEASTRRHQAEEIRKRDYAACLDEILVNPCRDNVRSDYIKRLKAIRQMEIDANALDRVAKARENELQDASKTPPKPAGRPAPAEGTVKPKTPPRPAGKPASGAPRPTGKVPTPEVSPEAQASADAERARKQADADKRRGDEQQAAAIRAQNAREDSARYEQRQREHAEKMAQKAQKNSSKKTATSTPASK